MTMFYVFVTVLLTLLTLAAGLYWVIPWLMNRDCEFQLHESDYGVDLNSNVSCYEYDESTDTFKRIVDEDSQ